MSPYPKGPDDLKTYHGNLDGNVTVLHRMSNGHMVYGLPLFLEHVNHSPTGFAWGYEGSGPAQLSFALLFDATGDLDTAMRLYQDYKRWSIAKYPQNMSWSITDKEILRWVESQPAT